MPELPDIKLYLRALRSRVLGETLEYVRVANPFLLRSVNPPLVATFGRSVTGISRLGKSDWPRTPEELEERRRI